MSETFTINYPGRDADLREVSGIVWSPPVEDFVNKFDALAREWRRETDILSSIQSKIFNPNYQRVMAMGKRALPLIFDDLQRNGGHWYWALECITGDDPAIHADSIIEAKEAWLRYASQHGYINGKQGRN